MEKEYANNTKAIEKTKAEIEKYSNITGLTEKQMESYAKKLEAAKSKLSTFEKAQEANTKEVESARKVIVDYERVLNKKSERLNAARTKMREYAKALAETNKRAEEGKKKLKEWGEAAEKSIDSIIKRTAQIAVAMGTIIAGFAVKEGFGEAMNLEGYKMQLETATKSTEKAGQLMSNAIKFANSTPFETGQVVEATAKMEAMGASSERWLKDVADMAGATNKDIIQATEAMIDARKGEYERLKEFGLDKEQVLAKATEMYGKKALGKKVDENKKRVLIENALQKLMQEKFAGGAEKQAKTLKGLWSTVTGVTKSSLATIVGLTNNGTIRQGSLFDKLKQHIEKVVDILNKWQKDGTIDAIAEKVTAAVDNMITFFSNLFNFIKEHRVLIETVLVFVGSIYLTVKAIAALKIALTAVSVVMGLLNGTIALTPLGWIVIAIAGVVTACYLLWQHLDAVINMFKGLFAWIKNLLDSLGPFGFAFAALTGPIGLVVTAVLGLIQHFDKLKAGAEKVWGFVKRIFGAEDTEIKATTEENSNSKITEEQIQNIKNDAPKGIGATKLPEIKNENKKSDPYFGENKKYTQSKEMAKKQETKIEVIIQGDVYGMDDFNEKVADAVVKMVEQNKANVVR